MDEIYTLLLAAEVCFLATCEDGQPQLRPFGGVQRWQGRLYFPVERAGSVSRQLHLNPRLAVCAALGDDWLQLSASAVRDDDRSARAALLEDGSAELWYLRNCTAGRYHGPELLQTWRF